MIAQELVKHTAQLHWLSAKGVERVERFAAWTASDAAHKSWVRARSLRMSGEALTFKVVHKSERVA